MSKDTARIRDQLGKDPEVFPILNSSYSEDVIIEEGPTIIEGSTLGNSWIVGTSTNGIVGTNTGTVGGGQQVVGGSGRVETVERVLNENNTHKEYFDTTCFKDITATNATWSGDDEVSFNNTNVATSNIIAKDDTVYSKANLNYTTSTPSILDLSDAYSFNEVSIWSNTNLISGLFFNNAGTRLYVVNNNTTLHQYNLSTGFDLNTITYSHKTIDISTELTNGGSLWVGNNKLYVHDIVTRKIYQYSFGTTDDLSTLTYDSVSLDLSGTYTGFMGGLFLKPDGTKLYFNIFDDEKQYQYSLSTPYDISTATSDSIDLDTSSQGVFNAVYFTTDGLTMYGCETSEEKIFEYTLTTAWDLSTASYSGEALTLSTFIRGVYYSESKDSVFFIEVGGARMQDYSLVANLTFELTANNGTDWDVIVPGELSSFTVPGEEIKWRATAQGSITLDTVTINYS